MNTHMRIRQAKVGPWTFVNLVHRRTDGYEAEFDRFAIHGGKTASMQQIEKWAKEEGYRVRWVQI